MRLDHTVFRHSAPTDFRFILRDHLPVINYVLADNYYVLLNGQSDRGVDYTLPDGEWQVLVDGNQVYNGDGPIVSERLNVPATCGVVLLAVKNN